jgi:hypothetical protein
MSSIYIDGSTPLDAAHMNALQQKVEKAAVNGYASLDASGRVPVSQLPTTAALAPAYGTTLPASPVDGQEAILVDSTTAPTYQWRFRYNAGNTTAYKWEFVGGSAQHGESTGGGTLTGGGVWSAFTGMTLTLPRAGVYLVQGGYRGTTPGTGTGAYHVGYAPNGAIDQSVGDWQVAASSDFAIAGPERSMTFTAVGSTVGLWYWATYAATVGFPLWLSVRPQRVS